MPDPIYIYPQQLFTVTVHTLTRTDYTFPASTTSEARNYILEMLDNPDQHHYLDELNTGTTTVSERIVAIERNNDHEI